MKIKINKGSLLACPSHIMPPNRKWDEIFKNIQTDKEKMMKKIVYFCPYCSAVGWSGSPEHFESHVFYKHGKIVKAKECITDKVKVYDRYLEREQFEDDLKLSV